jgi:quercetin dioxygenase-like cupin family protein
MAASKSMNMSAHGDPEEIAGLDSRTEDLPSDKTKDIIQTAKMELARLVMPKDNEFPIEISGPLAIQCLQGKILLTAMGTTEELHSGQLHYMMPGGPFLLKIVEDSVIILTNFIVY